MIMCIFIFAQEYQYKIISNICNNSQNLTQYDQVPVL